MRLCSDARRKKERSWAHDEKILRWSMGIKQVGMIDSLAEKLPVENSSWYFFGYFRLSLSTGKGDVVVGTYQTSGWYREIDNPKEQPT